MMRNIFKRSAPAPEENPLATPDQLLEIASEVERLTPVMTGSHRYPGSPDIVDNYDSIYQIPPGVIRLSRTNTTMGSLEDPDIMRNWHIVTDEAPTEKIAAFLVGRRVSVDVDMYVSSRTKWERKERLRELDAKGKKLGLKMPPKSALENQLGSRHIVVHDTPFGASKVTEQVYDAETGKFSTGPNMRLWQELATAKELRLNDVVADRAQEIIHVYSEAVVAERPALQILTSNLARIVLSNLQEADVSDRLDRHPWAFRPQ